MKLVLVIAALTLSAPAHADPLNEALDIFIGRVATAMHSFDPDAPKRITGTITVAGTDFKFISGGFGYSIPYGIYPITPDDIGDWGRAHGALGVNGGIIWDPRLQRDRIMIELHALRDPRGTDGCVGVVHYDDFKKLVLAMIKKSGRAFLHITPNGAFVSPEAFDAIR